MKRFINITLENSWNIGQSKRYNQIFEIIISYTKRRLLFIVFLDPDIMINVLDVNFNKELYSYNPI